MWPLCHRWSSMQTTNEVARRPTHPSLRHSRDTPEESLPWLPALSSSPRNPRTLVPSVSLAGARQAPTRAQAPPSGRKAVARAGAGGWGASAMQGGNAAGPSHAGGFQHRGARGRRSGLGCTTFTPWGAWGTEFVVLFLEAWRSCQVWASDLGSTLGFSWQGSWIFPFHHQLSVRPSVAWLLL